MSACRILVLLAAVVACGRSTTPNVVLVTLDTTRADRLGAMGHDGARTPVLDALAARGMVFERAYASASLTLPSHATILTGLDPNQHGLHDNGRFVLPASATTVAEVLAARGFDTAAFVSAFVLDADFGLNQGFARYDDDVEAIRDPLRYEMPRRPGNVVTDRALEWLGDRGGRPFFLWVHYYDVHLPRKPPPPFDAMADPYDGALAYVDAEVGRLLDGVTRAAGGGETLVVVVADHGEGLAAHDEETHGFLAYDATLHVPLVIAGPGFAPGRSRALVRTVDVAATIAAAAGVPPLAGSSGRALQTARAEDDVTAYFESFGPWYRLGWARLGGVRSGPWKLTAEPEPIELYDTVADPDETANRAADEPDVVARLRALWNAQRPAVAESPPPASPADVAEKLAALGYLDVARPDASADAPDPRRFVAALQLVDAVRGRAADGQLGDGIRALEALAASPVVRPLVLMYLSQLYLVAGRPADAVDAGQRLVAISGGLEPRLTLARALLEAGRADEALATVDAAHAAGLTSDRSRLARAAMLLALGRADEAEVEATAVASGARVDDQALAVASRARALRDGAVAEIPRLRAGIQAAPDPTRLVDARATLADLLRSVGQDAQAVDVLQAVTDPPVEHRVVLADIAAARGNPARAARLYEGVVAERPGVAAYRRQLADLYGTLGRHEDALRQYDLLVAAVPDDPGLLVDRGVTYAALARANDATADYVRALGLDDRLPEAHVNLALVELQGGDEADAERHLLRAVELRPDYRKAHFHLARLYGKRGDPRAGRHGEQAAGAGETD